MPSSLQIYSVQIANNNSNSAPSDGFIDPKRIELYEDSLETTPSGLTLDFSLAKRRGNWRYVEMVNQLQMVANCYIIADSITSDATDQAEASGLSFVLWTERGGVMVTADEANPGAYLTDEDAIKRCIARALIADFFKQTDIFDPTSAKSVPNTTTSVPRYGVSIGVASTFEIGAYSGSISDAESCITVTPIVT